MNVRSVSADCLTSAQIAAWSDLQRSEPTLESPFFRPEFTQAVAAVRRDVEVGLLEQDGKPVGFFPYQCDRPGIASPVGCPYADFQGLIVGRGVSWDPLEILRGCGLAAWHFDRLIVSQEPFRPYHWVTNGSPYLDLSRGWEAYLAAQVKEHKTSFASLTRKLRTAEKRVGQVRLEYHSADPRVFATLIDWKRQQFRRTKVPDVLQFPWQTDLLERVLDRQSEAFAGVLSSLHIGDHLAAIVMSIRSYGILHSWVAAYGPEFAEFSPGLLMWIELARASDGLGIRRIELGEGSESYKSTFKSGSATLAEGSVDLRPIPRVIRRMWRRTRRWVKLSPLGKPLEKPARVYFRLRNWLTKQ
jgi:CelD/BcsL family acetyltransferase involved in cellulose biosynthesis